MKWNGKKSGLVLLLFISTVLVFLLNLYNTSHTDKKVDDLLSNIEFVNFTDDSNIKYQTDSAFIMQKLAAYIDQYENLPALNEQEENVTYNYQITVHYNNAHESKEILIADDIIKLDGRLYNITAKEELNVLLKTADTASLSIAFKEPVEKQNTEKIVLNSKNNADIPTIYQILCDLQQYSIRTVTAKEDTVTPTIQVAQFTSRTSCYQVSDTKAAQGWINQIIDEYQMQDLNG